MTLCRCLAVLHCRTLPGKEEELWVLGKVSPCSELGGLLPEEVPGYFTDPFSR